MYFKYFYILLSIKTTDMIFCTKFQVFDQMKTFLSTFTFIGVKLEKKIKI